MATHANRKLYAQASTVTAYSPRGYHKSEAQRALDNSEQIFVEDPEVDLVEVLRTLADHPAVGLLDRGETHLPESLRQAVTDARAALLEPGNWRHYQTGSALLAMSQKNDSDLDVLALARLGIAVVIAENL